MQNSYDEWPVIPQLDSRDEQDVWCCTGILLPMKVCSIVCTGCAFKACLTAGVGVNLRAIDFLRYQSAKPNLGQNTAKNANYSCFFAGLSQRVLPKGPLACLVKAPYA